MWQKKIAEGAYALGLVAALFYIVYLFLAGLLNVLNSINSDLGKALVAAAATIVVATVTIVIGKIWEQRMKLQYDLREKKIPVYEAQIATFFKVMFAAKLGSKPTEAEIQSMFVSFSEKLRTPAEITSLGLAA